MESNVHFMYNEEIFLSKEFENPIYHWILLLLKQAVILHPGFFAAKSSQVVNL